MGERGLDGLRALIEKQLPFYPVLLCFVSRLNIPNYCLEMKRSPAPPLDLPFDCSFADVIKQLYGMNNAIYDGAIILGRSDVERDSTYQVTGWSYRLVPPFAISEAQPNRGSAYNSALSMSLVDNVDGVSLISHDRLELFAAGKEVRMDFNVKTKT